LLSASTMISALFATFGALLASPTLPPHGALRAMGTVQRVTAPLMRVHQTAIPFRSLDNPENVIAAVRSVVDTVKSWEESEWGSFGAPPLIFGTSTDDPNIVHLKFYPTDRQLYEDGALEIRLKDETNVFGGSRPVLTWTSLGKRREENEKIIYQMVLDECKSGELSTECVLEPGLHMLADLLAHSSMLADSSRASTFGKRSKATDEDEFLP